MTFEEGTLVEWLDVLLGLQEIWKQKMANGPSNHAAMVAAILKGESKTAFNAALEDARVDPDDNGEQLLLHNDHIKTALKAVRTIFFPYCVLEIQKLWIQCIIIQPVELLTRSMAAAITKINNSLPLFPLVEPWH